MSPRIELSDLFGGTVPEGIDAEKTGGELETRIEALIKAEGDGVRSSEQANLKTLQDEMDVKTAELEDLKAGTTGKPASTTESGGKAAEIRARQAAEAATVATDKLVSDAVSSRDAFWTATLEAKELGIPDTIIKRSGGDAEKLADLTVMYQELGGKTTKKGGGKLTPGLENQTIVESSESSSLEKVSALVSKMPMVSMSGGQVQTLA